MIVCPTCKHHQIDGTLFCSECGSQLVALEGAITQTMQDVPTGSLIRTVGELKANLIPPVLSIPHVSLHIIEVGQIIPLSGKEEYTLGRTVEGQSVLPDIDLSPFKAYEKGISRLHASIRIDRQQVTISDLGSINGTRLNGAKVHANQPLSLNHGDILSLGKLKIQVYIQNKTLR